SSPYSGERGERRVAGESADMSHRLRSRAISDFTRTLPLSPTLSPEYREEGVKLLASLALLLFLIGCQTPRTGAPLTKQLAANDPDAQLEFWHHLADQSIATN